MIALEHVSKRYGAAGAPVLQDVSFEIGRGDFAYVVGDDGSGRSTLIRLITRDEHPDEGAVWVAGRPLHGVPDRQIGHLRRQIGVVPTRPRLIEQLTAGDNVAFALQAIGTERRRIKRAVADALDLTGLTEVAGRTPGELTAAQRQHLVLARALAKDPTVLLADEPTARLDEAESAAFVRVLEQAVIADVTVLVATHDDDIVDGFRKRVIEIRDAQVARDEFGGTYRDIFRAGAPGTPAARSGLTARSGASVRVRA